MGMHPRYFVLEFRSQPNAADPGRNLECRWRRLSDADGADAGPWTRFTLSAELEEASRKLRETRDDGQFVILEHLAHLPAQPSDLAPVPQSRPAGVALIHAAQPEAKDIHGVAFEALFPFCFGACGLMHVMANDVRPQSPRVRGPGKKLPLRVLLLLTSLDSSHGSTTDYTIASVADIHRALANSEFAASIKLVVAASASVVDPNSPTTLVTAQARVPVDQVYRNADDLERLLRYGGVDATKDNAQQYDALITFGHSDAKTARDATGFEFEFPSADPRRVVIGGHRLAGWIGFPLRIVALINCGSRSIADPFLNHAPHVLAAQPRQLPVGIGIAIARGLTRVLTGTHSIADAACQIRRELEGDGWMLAHLADEAYDPTFVTPEEVMLAALHDVYKRKARMVRDGKSLRLQHLHVALSLEEQRDAQARAETLDFEGLLRQPHRRWILRGEPGAGKSWTLLFCAVTPGPEGRMVLFVALHEIESLPEPPRSGPEIAAYLEGCMPAELRHKGPALSKIAQAHSQHGLVILLDAYDEVTDTAKVNPLLSWFDDHWPEATVVVTCRKDTQVPHDERKWRTAHLQPLSDQQPRMVLRQLFEARGRTDAATLADTAVAQLRQGGHRMQELAGSPMLLSSVGELIVSRLSRGGAPDLTWLPALKRHQLLADIIDAHLAGEWADQTKRPRERTAAGKGAKEQDQTRRLLQHAAWQMTTRRAVHVPPDQIADILFGAGSPAAGLGRAARLECKTRLTDVGLLSPETAENDAKWGFRHRQLMEALASEYWWEVLLQEGHVDRLVDVILGEVTRAITATDFWAEPLALLAERLGDGSDLLKRLCSDKRTVDLGMRVFQALDCIQPETLEATMQALPAWDASWEDRRRRVRALALFPDRSPRQTTAATIEHLAEQATRADLPLAEIGALVHAIEEIGRTRRLAKEADDAVHRLLERLVTRARLGCLDQAAVEAHFRCVPGHDKDSLWAPIPAGSFQMGTAGAPANSREHPTSVTLSAFHMQATTVTRGQWRLFAPGAEGDQGSVRRPVGAVTWFESLLFARWLQHQSTRQDLNWGFLPPEHRFELPTEAQWEYSTRAGTTTRFWAGNDDDHLRRVGWFYRNAGLATHDVASLPPNAWGLYDVHGNVWEWCRDSFAERLPGGTDPLVLIVGAPRVYRGGCFGNGAGGCRSAHRDMDDPDYDFDGLGFRLVCVRVRPQLG